MTARIAPSPWSTRVSTPPCLRSAAGSRRAPTSLPAAWATTTSRTAVRPARRTGGDAEAGSGGTGWRQWRHSLSNSVDGHGTPVAGVIAQFVPQATIVPVNIFVPFTSVSVSWSSSSGRRHGGGSGGGTGGSRRRRPSLSGTANALTSSNLLYNGLQYVITHPFVNDPLRPGKVDRVIAASFAFGTTQTFQSEVDAYKNYPQIVIALKNAYHKFLKEGIAPIAASGEFGAPLGSGGASSTGGSGGVTSGTHGRNHR